MTVAPQLATLPLTAAQQGLLVVHRTAEVPHLYNVVAELELDPALAPRRTPLGAHRRPGRPAGAAPRGT